VPRQSSWPILAIIASLLFLGVAAFGAWRVLSQRSNPIDEANKFLNARKSLDWKTMRETAENPAAIDQQRADFADSPFNSDMVKRVCQALEFRLGDPAITGNRATIQIVVSVRGASNDETTTLAMKRVHGVWKVGTDNADFDQACSRAIAAAFVSPEIPDARRRD
jgi:hypothetical protein